MSAILHVYMDGVFCGQVIQSKSGDLRFTYDEGYRQSLGATPLSLSMPLSLPEHRKRVILPYLDGLITDNGSARQAMASRYNVSARSPFGILTHTGADVAGALQILPESETPTDRELPRGGYSPLSETDIADQLAAVVEEYRDGRAPSVGLGRFSLAGAQPKIALLQTPTGEWAAPTGATPTTHILKPASGAYRRVDIVEHMTMRAAAKLGFSVASTALYTFGSMRTFVTERYDRAFVDGRWLRLHQEDLGQALSVPLDKKYQREDGGPGVADVSGLFRGLGRFEDRAAAAEAFYEGLMFNTALECTDAHIKNYSVMLAGDTVKLAPLYDLATYAPYKAPDQTTYSAMKIGSEYRFSAIGEDQCLKAAALLRVDPDRAMAAFRHIRANAVGAFETVRDEMGADSETAEVANNVLDSVSRLPSLRGG